MEAGTIGVFIQNPGLEDELNRMFQAGALEQYTQRRRSALAEGLNKILNAMRKGKLLEDAYTIAVSAIIEGGNTLEDLATLYTETTGSSPTPQSPIRAIADKQYHLQPTGSDPVPAV